MKLLLEWGEAGERGRELLPRPALLLMRNPNSQSLEEGEVVNPPQSRQIPKQHHLEEEEEVGVEVAFTYLQEYPLLIKVKRYG